MPFIATATFVTSPCASLTARSSFISSFTCRTSVNFRPHHARAGRLLKPSPIQTPLASAAANGATLTGPTERTSLAPPLSTPPPPQNTQQKTQAPLPRFLTLFLKEWRLLIPALVCVVICSSCAVLEPILFGRILASMATLHTQTPAESRKKLYIRVTHIFITYVIEMISSAIFVRFSGRVADRAMRQLREKLFKATLRNDVAFFDHAGRENIERTTSLQLKIARQAFWDNLSEDRGIRAALEAVLGIIICLKITGRVGIPFFLVVMPTVTAAVARFGLRLGRLSARVEGKEADFLAFIGERMRGLRTLKAFGAEEREFSDLTTLLDKSEEMSTSFIDSRSMTECANRLNIYITILIFFLFGGYMVSIGSMTFESFSSLIGFIWVLNFALHGLQFTLTDTTKASVALSKVYAILDDATAYSAAHEANHYPPTSLPPFFQGDIRLENVSFHYPSRPDTMVLKNISLEIQRGQTIALVGDSGGGKSTLAALLCRFYAPTEGMVTLDGIDIQCIPSDIFARQLSVVDQDPFLFQGTIRDNIAYGLPDKTVTEEDIIRAATQANAHRFISELHDGYDTVWHPGSNLSGGQRQRIAIARSLVKSPRILVLDEATSALDQESERLVQVALEGIMKNRTTLIIAHRLSTVRSADQILFVKGGEIIERGTFDELVAKPEGRFRALVDSSSPLVSQAAE